MAKRHLLSDRLVKIEYGVPKVSQKLAEFMASIKAKESTRYAIGDVGIAENTLAVTDGRRLLAVTPTDGVYLADGIYHLTGEGFLLKKDEDKDERFPKWREIIPKEASVLDEFFRINDDHGDEIAKVVSAINNAGCILKFRWLLGAIDGFSSCGCDTIRVTKPDGNKPILVTAETSSGNLQYVQMPLSQ